MKKPTKPKKVKLEKIILTIRATQEPEIKALKELKESLNEKTYSGAIMTAAKKYRESISMRDKLISENSKLRNDLQNINAIVERWLNVQNEMVHLKTKQKHKPYPTRSE